MYAVLAMQATTTAAAIPPAIADSSQPIDAECTNIAHLHTRTLFRKPSPRGARTVCGTLTIVDRVRQFSVSTNSNKSTLVNVYNQLLSDL
eukprot:2249796-Pleurochrysis_carterae.AAC.1